jgi:hypothetical protein
MSDVPFNSRVVGLKEMLVDMGDGTHALRITLPNGATGASAIGNPTDAAWNGSDPAPSLIAIMKAVHAQLVAINANTGT